MFDDRISEDASAGFAQKNAPGENPFRPISVADRLKGAPKRPTHTHASVKPMRPGQLYGVTHEPEPVKENPYAPPAWTPPAERVDAATSTFEPLTPPAPFPSAHDASPAYTDAHTQAHQTTGLPPYLKKRPSLTPHSAAENPAPQQEAETAGDASGAQFVSFHDYMSPTHVSHSAEQATKRRSHRIERDTVAAPESTPQAAYETPYDPASGEPYTASYTAPYIPQGAAQEPPPTPAEPDFTAHPEWLTPPVRKELPLYMPPIEFDPYAMQETDVPYQPTFNGELPYMPSQDSQEWEPAKAPYLQAQEPSPNEPFVTDEIASFLGEGYSAPMAGISQAEAAQSFEPEQPAPYVADEQPVWKDPFAPAVRYKEGQEVSAPPRAIVEKPKPQKPQLQKKPPKPESQKPPVRPWRVISLVAAVAMLVFCGIAGGRIVFDLATNEREMEAVRNDYLQSQGVPLEAAGARVELLPPGQTFEPTATPVMVETPSPEPLIAMVRSNTEDPNQAVVGELQAGAQVTPTPPARTVAERYEKNPLRNTMESMRALSDEYTDVVGRLTIDGVLNEVVVSRNNTFYLTHNYRGATSDAGAVFVDESCTIERPPENLLLRGQSAIEGKVFAPLWQYQTGGREFVASHTSATLTTLYEEERYVLFAVIVADSDPNSSGYFNYASHPTFATDESMLSYVQSARDHSLYEFTVDVAATDRLLTLATLGTDNRCLVLIFRMM